MAVMVLSLPVFNMDIQIIKYSYMVKVKWMPQVVNGLI